MKWLVELQKADARLQELQRLQEELPRKIESIAQEIQKGQEELKEAEERFDGIKLQRRKKEHDLDVENDKINKSKNKLLEVKTNKEYQALLKEIDMVRQNNGILEEEILVLMEQMDDGAAAIAKEKAEFQAREEELSRRKQQTQEQLDGLEIETERLQSERETAAAAIEANHFNLYEALRKRNHGLAVVPVNGGACKGCFLNIQPQLYNEILKFGNVTHCPHCQRFIYVEPEAPKEETAQSGNSS